MRTKLTFSPSTRTWSPDCPPLMSIDYWAKFLYNTDQGPQIPVAQRWARSVSSAGCRATASQREHAAGAPECARQGLSIWQDHVTLAPLANTR